VKEVNEMVFVQARVLDSTHLELATPITASRGGKVFLVITEQANSDAERKPWMDGSSESLRAAYGNAEPEYTSSMVRENNPDYGA
jgi:hypothetical protein